MEIFYSKNIAEGGRVLDPDESGHCIRVLRHRRGDVIHVVDGRGMLYCCTILDDDPRAVVFEVTEQVENYGGHDYHLTMAVCPPKNADRFEWFAEKVTEIGVDVISPVFGDYSERKIFKPERIGRLLVSAAKQSHKGAVPLLENAVTVSDFLRQDRPGLKLICYCGETEGKTDIKEALRTLPAGAQVTVLIGPEGDFSRKEMALAAECGWQPVSLGDSRLRIETAALVAAAAVYLNFTR